MKVVVTAQGTHLESLIDPRFGRAGYFLLVDTDTLEATAHSNAQNLNLRQGAGIQAAQAVITGHVGPKAFATLQAANVAVYTGATGTVREAIQQLTSGRLSPAERPDVAGHWA